MEATLTVPTFSDRDHERPELRPGTLVRVRRDAFPAGGALARYAGRAGVVVDRVDWLDACLVRLRAVPGDRAVNAVQFQDWALEVLQ